MFLPVFLVINRSSVWVSVVSSVIVLWIGFWQGGGGWQWSWFGKSASQGSQSGQNHSEDKLNNTYSSL